MAPLFSLRIRLNTASMRRPGFLDPMASDTAATDIYNFVKDGGQIKQEVASMPGATSKLSVSFPERVCLCGGRCRCDHYHHGHYSLSPSFVSHLGSISLVKTVGDDEEEIPAKLLDMGLAVTSNVYISMGGNSNRGFTIDHDATSAFSARETFAIALLRHISAIRHRIHGTATSDYNTSDLQMSEIEGNPYVDLPVKERSDGCFELKEGYLNPSWKRSAVLEHSLEPREIPGRTVTVRVSIYRLCAEATSNFSLASGGATSSLMTKEGMSEPVSGRPRAAESWWSEKLHELGSWMN